MAEILNQRRCGNSTRQIDEWVQLLFKNGEVEIIDHAGTNYATTHSLKILRKRLEIEHGLSWGETVTFNPKTRILKFSK